MKKIVVSLGDIREAWYIMECPCAWKDFLESYTCDKQYQVINDWAIYNNFDEGGDESYEF